jgi:hypothetical protein
MFLGDFCSLPIGETRKKVHAFDLVGTTPSLDFSRQCFRKAGNIRPRDASPKKP